MSVILLQYLKLKVTRFKFPVTVFWIGDYNFVVYRISCLFCLPTIRYHKHRVYYDNVEEDQLIKICIFSFDHGCRFLLMLEL